jgi:hypothetical protein
MEVTDWVYDSIICGNGTRRIDDEEVVEEELSISVGNGDSSRTLIQGLESSYNDSQGAVLLWDQRREVDGSSNEGEPSKLVLDRGIGRENTLNCSECSIVESILRYKSCDVRVIWDGYVS